MKNVNAFKNLVVADVLSGDCKLVVNGYIAKDVTAKRIEVILREGIEDRLTCRYFYFNTLEEVTLLPEKTKFRCSFKNRYNPEMPDVVEIELMKVVNFRGWVFDND